MLSYTGTMNNSLTRAGCPDPIPYEDRHETSGPDTSGMLRHRFLAFNTVIELQAFGSQSDCTTAFDKARLACRHYERLFSRTLPHSDIARLNAAHGKAIDIAPETATLLRAAQDYCADSEGCFDITMGAVVRLWDFHTGVVPQQTQVRKALAHVDWRCLEVCESIDGRAQARLADAQAAVDVGGIAKGWIADKLTDLLIEHGLESFIVNLGGNVVAHGLKPSGEPWRIGIKDPREAGRTVGSLFLKNASAVTSGVYERCFTRDGQFYHHILDPATGMPVHTDAAGATVIAKRSIDAEGYSTTLLALGIDRGRAFIRKRPVIEQAFFVDSKGSLLKA